MATQVVAWGTDNEPVSPLPLVTSPVLRSNSEKLVPGSVVGVKNGIDIAGEGYPHNVHCAVCPRHVYSPPFWT
jgi:hypothetical protein